MIYGDRNWLAERVSFLSDEDVIHYASFLDTKSRIIPRLLEIINRQAKEIEDLKNAND